MAEEKSIELRVSVVFAHDSNALSPGTLRRALAKPRISYCLAPVASL